MPAPNPNASAKAPSRKGKPASGPRVVLSGYYGFDNFGDELICKALTTELKARGCRPVVLSRQPKLTHERYKTGAASRDNVLSLLWQLIHADVLLSGGGGLFQDSTGPNSVSYYGGLILLAKGLGVPSAHIFQSVGPLTSAWGKGMTRQALNACRWVCVRDEGSAERVKELTGTRPMVAADAAFLLPAAPPKVNEAPPELHRVGISLRPHPRLNHAGLETLASIVAEWASRSVNPVELALLVCQPGMDESVLQSFQFAVEAAYEKKAALDKPIIHYEWITGQEALEATIPTCHQLLGMRFHSLVAGLMAGVPIYGLSYDPKVDALLQSIPLDGSPVDKLEQLTYDQFETYWKAYPVELTGWVNEQRTQAQIAFNALESLILGPVQHSV